jgi:hypothetical protein
VDKPVENLVRKPVDEAARGRLRHAIVAEDGDDEHLDGVLRMLGAETPGESQLLLFGKGRARNQSSAC